MMLEGYIAAAVLLAGVLILIVREARRRRRECDGSILCESRRHLHGCFAERRSA